MVDLLMKMVNIIYNSLIVDKENNKVLRPRYYMKEMLIAIDENSRYVINLNR